MNTDRAYILEACTAFVCQTHSLNVNAGKRRLSVKKAKRQMIGMTEVRSETMYYSAVILLIAGIRKTATWYTKHISLNKPPVRGQKQPIFPTVVLLTEDAANRTKSEQAGISALSGELFH